MTQEEKASILHSGLQFRRALQEAADNLLCTMVAKNDGFGAVEFQTQAGRPVVLCMAMGEEMVAYVKGKLKKTPKDEANEQDKG